GVALCLWMTGMVSESTAEWLGSDSVLSAMAIIFSVIAACVSSFVGQRGRESHEAITGWIFLMSASVSVLVVSHSPHCLEDVQRLISSSIIGATDKDVWVFAGFLILSAVTVVIAGRPLLFLVMDAPTASALGMRTARWSALLAIWLGLSIGLSMRV